VRLANKVQYQGARKKLFSCILFPESAFLLFACPAFSPGFFLNADHRVTIIFLVFFHFPLSAFQLFNYFSSFFLTPGLIVI